MPILNYLSVCFAATATMQLESDMSVTIPDVNVKDRVFVFADGVYKYSDNVFIPHACDNTAPSSFVELTTSFGRARKEIRCILDTF